MKGVIKCGFSLGMLLVALAVFSSVFFSENVSALKHFQSRMPLYDYVYINSSGTSSWTWRSDLSFYFDSSYVPEFDLTQTNSPAFFGAQGNSAHSSCSYSSSYRNFGHWKWTGGSLNRLYVDSRVAYDHSNPNNNNSYCQQNNPFGSSGMSPMDWNSIPLGNDQAFNRLNPYSYSYASYYYRDSGDIDGRHYTAHGIMTSDFLGVGQSNFLTKVKKINIPIGAIKDIKSDDFTSIVNGTSINFNYELYLTDLDMSQSDLTAWDSSFVVLHYGGLDDNNQVRSGNVTCTKDPVTYDYAEGTSFANARLSFSCPFVSSYNFTNDLIGFEFVIDSDSTYNYLWDVTYDSEYGGISFYSDSIYVVTNYDDSPGGDIGGSDSGARPQDAPGSIENEFLDSDEVDAVDWFLSLTNLFGFSFINPFAPLFNMFTDQSQCASIPTIAGMLHSEETSYCPWFDSSTRNVLTPVLSIASMMLIFGFVVRWLSSSSGNMFEDQTTHKWGNTQFKQGGK